MGREVTLEVIRASARGDRAAYREIVDCYSDWLYVACCKLVPPADAREAVQDALLAVADGKYDDIGAASLSTWLWIVARNRCRDLLRKRNRSPVAAVAELPDLASAAPSPEQALLDGERDRAFAAALQLLSEEHRSLIDRHYKLGMSFERIAEMDGIPVGTVKSRLNTARKALAERWRKSSRKD